jgi:hypothetical protein
VRAGGVRRRSALSAVSTVQTDRAGATIVNSRPSRILAVQPLVAAVWALLTGAPAIAVSSVSMVLGPDNVQVFAAV